MGLNYFDYFLESIGHSLITESEKVGVFKDGKYIQDNLQNVYIHDKLTVEANREKIIEFTGMFMDAHMRELSTAGPVFSFTFNDKDTSFFYNLFDITKEKIIEIYDNMVKETYYGKISKFFTGWVYSAPHKLIFGAMLVDAIQNEYDDIIECCEYLWAFCEYPMAYSEFWSVGAREDVMAYTMEHLGAKYKFIQKKMKTLRELLKYHAEVSVSAMKIRLRTGADNEYMDFMQRLHNQIWNSFRNIANEYYKNHKDNKTLHMNSSTYNDGKIAEQEGHTTNLSQIVDNTINKLDINWVNNSLLKAAADASKVDASVLTGFINNIFSTKGNKVPEFVERLFTTYFNEYPSSSGILNKSEFLSFGLKVYRSLGSDTNIPIRNILNMWMNDIIGISKMYNSAGTIANYQRAVYNYMIFIIAHYN